MQLCTGWRALGTNAAANVAAFAAQLAVTFALAPKIIAALGPQRYGVWSLLESLLMYLALADLGVASALVRFLPPLVAKHDRAGIDRLLSTALAFFAGMAALILGGLAVAVACGLRGELAAVAGTLVGGFAVSLVGGTFGAALDGLGRYAPKSAARAACLFLRLPLTLLALQTDRPLVALAGCAFACTLLEQLTFAVLVFRAVPGLRISVRSLDHSTFRQIRGYSWDSFVALIAGRLAFHSDAFVIGPILGTAAVGQFAIAGKLVETAKLALRQGTTTLTYAFSALDAQADPAAVRRTLLGATRLVLYAILPVQAGLLLLGGDFLRLWVGPDYAAASGPVMLVLALPLGLTLAQSVSARALYGLGKLRGFARASLAEGVANLALSLSLVERFGIVGVAWGTTIPHVALCVATITLALKHTGTPLRSYAAAWLRPAFAAAAFALTAGLLRGAGGVESWGRLAAVVAGGLVPCALGALALEGRRLLPWDRIPILSFIPRPRVTGLESCPTADSLA